MSRACGAAARRVAMVRTLASQKEKLRPVGQAVLEAELANERRYPPELPARKPREQVVLHLELQTAVEPVHPRSQEMPSVPLSASGANRWPAVARCRRWRRSG
ncbi:hypothetical protein ZIOFF_009309 [Zingiber officinale]|uniref:Uncharacterized protein n=1 Tax=Zingiber officinale TaxID=94328 RepID=A0A8J5HFF0_ZINOF|nr:hypothetical protein ZIOFF_009309 [Zingiber officinale]